MMNETKVQTPFLAPDGAPSLADLLAATAPPMPPQAPLPAPEESLREAPPVARAAVQDHAGFGVDASAVQDAAPVRAPLLLVCMARSEGALIQAWLVRVLAGALPRCVAFEDNVIERVLRQEPQAVLIQFDADCVDAAVALSEQLQRSAPHIPRVAVGAGQQPASMRAALRSGAQDFLDVNDSLETAQQALSAMLNRRVVPPAGMALAPVTALVSARAGMGCSVLAAHLAWYLQMQLARAQSPAGAAADGSEVGASSLRAGAMSGDDERALEALLIEVSQPGGDCAIYLNTPGEFRFADALHQRQRMDRRMAQIALARHASGLRMLTQTHASLAGKGAQSAQDEQAVSGQCADLLQRLRTYFRHLLLDMGACDAQRPQSIDMLLAARDIWVVCDQSVASVVWTMELLQQFDACSIPRDRMRLIVGRHDARIDLSAEQLAQQLRLPLLAVIPERRRELAQQLNQGELLHPRQTREPFVQAVSRLASGLLAGHHPELVQDSASSASAWARLLARMTRH